MEDTLLLTDLIDISILQEMQNSFSKMTGIAAYITDVDGNHVTGCSCQSDFCSKYTRASVIGAKRCKTSDISNAKQAFHQGRTISYHCHAGLRNFATPILVGDQLIGCVFCLLEPLPVFAQVAAQLLDLLGELPRLVGRVVLR